MTNYQFKKFTWIEREALGEVMEVLASNNLSGFLATEGVESLGGKEVRRLESAWAAFERTPYAIAFNSWTSGLEASIESLNLPKGSEVITTPWTMSATTAVLLNCGLRPRFVDIKIENFNIDVDQVENAINRNTSAILAVDIFGYPCDSPKLRDLSDKYSLKLIIDSAQAPLARINGLKPSHYADVSGYSFNRHKHLQCGEGGMAVTNNLEIYKNLVALRNHAEVSYADAAFDLNGRNLRFGEVEAILIRKQLEKIEMFVNHRRNAAESLKKNLSDTFLEFAQIDSGVDHDYYIFPMRLPKDYGAERRKNLAENLTSQGIPGVLEKYVVTHRLKRFEKFVDYRLSNAEFLQDQGFFGIYMCGVEWSEESLAHTSETIKRALT